MKTAWILMLAVFSMVRLEAGVVTVEVRSPKGPVAQQKVELFSFAEGQPQSSLSKTTDSAGVVRFTLPDKAQLQVAARTVFQDVNYFSDVLPFQNSMRIPIRVFEAVKSSEGLSVSEVRSFASLLDEGLRIEQEIVLENAGTKTLLGVSQQQGFETFRFSVPSSAFDLQLGSGFTKEETRFEGNDIIYGSPVPPGQTHLSLVFSIEAKRLNAELKQKFSAPVTSLAIATADKLSANGSGLVVSGKKFTSDEWAQVFESNLSGAREFAVTFSGLPLRLRFSQWIPLAFLLVLLGLTWLLAVRTSARPSTALSAPEREQIIDDLVYLDRARKEKLIADSEYQLRRLLLLEKLMHDYASS